MSKEENPLTPLYSLRNEFLIIGLTGRLGSGCSTVASLLTNDNFDDCVFPKPECSTSVTNEERKYKIVYNFLRENWKPYTLIRASDVITALVLREGLSEFEIFLGETYKGKEADVRKIVENISAEFDSLSSKVQPIFNESLDFEIESKADDIYRIFFETTDIKSFNDRLKEEFNRLKITNGNNPFQHFGDNIRKTGNPFKNKDFKPQNCYVIANLIKQLIKLIRKKNKDSVDGTDKGTRIIIDSIRNSLEARYFKERYSAFYLCAVNTEDEMRKKRLREQYNAQEIGAMDGEYTKNLEAEERFYKQDIQSCIQVADIYLSNPDEKSSEGDKRKTIKMQIVRYLSLILQPGIITPTPEERCMQIAYTAKYNSGCISRQVGAVVTDNAFSIKSIGWNNTAEGQTPCLLRSVEDLTSNADSEAFSEYEKEEKFKGLMRESYSTKSASLQGRNVSFCFKDGQNCIDGYKNQVHTRSLHAEENAMLQIAKYGGEGLKSGFLFTTASPCELCSKKAYQLGIKKIFYIDPYPGISEKQILKSGVSKHWPETQLFVGAVGRAYHHLFEPFMPYKDELETLIGFDYKKTWKSLQDPIEYRESLQKRKEEIDKELAVLDGTINTGVPLETSAEVKVIKSEGSDGEL